MDKVQEIAFKLHDLLKESAEYKCLKEKENTMLNNDGSSSLISQYKQICEKYSYAKNEETLKEMHEIKLKLDLNEHVIDYKKAYKQYQLLISEITDIVFEDFSFASLTDKIIRAK